METLQPRRPVRSRARRYGASRYAGQDNGIVADSGALRARRSRAHKAGDHSLCRHDDRRPVVVVPPPGDARIDPRVSLEALARRLEAAHEADPANDRLARVLKDVLLALPAGTGADDDDDDDPLAELRALVS